MSGFCRAAATVASAEVVRGHGQVSRSRYHTSNFQLQAEDGNKLRPGSQILVGNLYVKAIAQSTQRGAQEQPGAPTSSTHSN